MKPQRATSVATWGSRFSIGPSRATPATPARAGRHFQIGGPVQRWHRCNGDPAPVHLSSSGMLGSMESPPAPSVRSLTFSRTHLFPDLRIVIIHLRVRNPRLNCRAVVTVSSESPMVKLNTINETDRKNLSTARITTIHEANGRAHPTSKGNGSQIAFRKIKD